MEGKFFDLFDRENNLLITDYQHLKNEIILGTDNSELKIGEVHKRKAVHSIEELRIAFEQIIPAAIQCLNKAKLYSDYSICDSENNLLANQLILDILFDKYCKESKKMTRYEYADYMSQVLNNRDCDRLGFCKALSECLSRGMKKYYKTIQSPGLTAQVEMLGVDPKKYDEYNNPSLRNNPYSKRPKYLWDHLYYNFCMNLTKKQYRRQLTRKNRNYPYEVIINDLNEYNSLVAKLLPVDNESPQKYFEMSMDYYHLESYKRVDFMFKLQDYLTQMGIHEIDKDCFPIKRFIPSVLVPYVENGKLCFGEKQKYYRPLLFAEDALFSGENYTYDYNIEFFAILQKCQIIRAKAYELFMYHCEFISEDYFEIKNFLSHSYNMRAYHESNYIWKDIEGKNWKQIGKAEKTQFKETFKLFMSINDALFWKSPDRTTAPEKQE